MWIHLIAAPLALLAPALLAPPLAPVPSGSAVTASTPLAGEDYEALEAEYEQALKTHKAELRRLRGKERVEFAKNKPEIAFWSRFGSLAEAGDGRALFWQAAHARDRADSLSEGRLETRRLYLELVERYAAEDWFGQVVQQLPRERSSLGGETVAGMYRAVIAKNPGREVQASAIEELVDELRRLKTPAADEEALALLDRLAADYADTKVGGRVLKERRLAVGAVAPDFTGTTIDGYEFKLSDYRGKVVLVDFYGFW